MFGGGRRPAARRGNDAPMLRRRRAGANVTRPTKRAHSRENRVIHLRVREVSADSKYVQLDGGLDAGVEVGDRFMLIHRITGLPAARYTSYQSKDLLIGEAVVIDVEKATCRCKIVQGHTINPVRVGNDAVANLY